jgi:sialate O-acetylesterase
VKWYDPAFDAGSWKKITVPGYWEDLGHADLNGVVWFRKDFNLDVKMKGVPGRLFLGRIVDADEVYLNGIRIGSTSYQYPQRRYRIPEGLLKQGSNTLVVRVSNFSGKGGFVPDKQYAICTATDTTDISGEWRFRVGQLFYPSGKAQPNQVFSLQSQPAALFNAMVAPLISYPIKGICWYQGESNVAHPENYLAYHKSLIRDWRKQWKHDSLPFIYVQLPGFQSYQYLPTESNWALLREAQLKTLMVPHTAMAVAIDLGEWNDIHPDNKKDVGERMAMAARHLSYKDTVKYSGPIFSRVVKRGNELVVHFEHVAGGLLTVDGEPPASFAVAGQDKKFVPAKARIEGNTVVVWNEKIDHPLYVRYAWADNPVNPNLCNTAKLPASPFRNDY